MKKTLQECARYQKEIVIRIDGDENEENTVEGYTDRFRVFQSWDISPIKPPLSVPTLGGGFDSAV